MFRSTAATLALTFALVACSSSSDDADSDAAAITKTCLKNRCDERSEADRYACSRCMSACFGASYDCDSSSACKESCSPSRPCSDNERTSCVEEGFSMTLPTRKSDALEAACQRVIEHAMECRWRVGSMSCSIIAKTERPERTTEYDCLANLPCDSDNATIAACKPADTDFGVRLCAAMDGTCPGFCTDDFRETLNAAGAWLKDSVLDAAMTCADQQACGDARDCFGAWVTGANL